MAELISNPRFPIVEIFESLQGKALIPECRLFLYVLANATSLARGAIPITINLSNGR